MKKKILKFVAVVVLVIIIIILSSSYYVVAENEFACIVRFAKIIDTKESPGLYFKNPFVDTIRTFPKAIMFYDIPPSEVLTSDKQNMTIDSYVLWRISDPLKFFKTLGSVSAAEGRLDAITYNALKNVMGTLAQHDIINQDPPSERNDIYADITFNVDVIAKNYGIDIIDIKIKRFDLPEANEQAVYQRMISERNQISEKYIADGEYLASVIRNDVDKQVGIIVSNAEAQAAKIVAEGEEEYLQMIAKMYDSKDKQEFYQFMLALDALESSLQGNEKTLILGSKSFIAKMLIGVN